MNRASDDTLLRSREVTTYSQLIRNMMTSVRSSKIELTRLRSL